MILHPPPPLDSFWAHFIVGFILGAVLGSFGTMLAYRLPRKLSIVTPRSHCTSCQKTLQPLDLVPLLSFLANKGRCRHCGAVIGFRYFWIELACALLCALATVILGFSAFALAAYALILALVVIVSLKRAS